MKKIFFLLLISSQCFGQKSVDLRGDSIRIYKEGGSAELVLRNKTKDTLGYLYNTGNGITEFRKISGAGGSANLHGSAGKLLYLGSDGSGYTGAHPITFDTVGSGTTLLKMPINGEIDLFGRDLTRGGDNLFTVRMMGTDSAGRVGFTMQDPIHLLGGYLLYNDFDSSYALYQYSGLNVQTGGRDGLANQFMARFSPRGNLMVGYSSAVVGAADYNSTYTDVPYKMAVFGNASVRGQLELRPGAASPAINVLQFPNVSPAFQYLLRATPVSVTNTDAFEMAIDNNANGGPPDDNVLIQGFNIDSRTNPISESWTIRMEDKFQGGNYEYHLQFSDPGFARLYRLMSFTFRNHGNVATDENLLFFMVSGLEVRNLAGTGFWSVSNNIISGPDVANMVMSNRPGTKQITYQLDDANNVFNLSSTAGSMPAYFSNFTNFKFIYQSSGGPSMDMGLFTTAFWAFQAPYLYSNTDRKIILDNPVVYSDGDDAILRFTPGSGAGAVRGFIDVNQGVGAMIFSVQNGGYFHRWDLGGVTEMVLNTTSLSTTVPIITPASTTGTAGFRVPAGTAPSSPVNGDVYQDGTHAFMRIGGAWKQLDN